MIRHTIWNSEIDMENWQDFLAEEHPDLDPDDPEAYELVAEKNALYLDDERMNLNITLDTPIICFADLGLWHGRCPAYKEIGTNIADCLQSQVNGDSECHWYVDEFGDLCCREAHHDGVNYYTYRAVKPTPSGDIEKRMETIENRFRADKMNDWAMRHYTYRLGDAIAAVYGWKITQRGRRKEA